MNTVSIGFYREDGDFAVLAALNNNDEHLPDDAFLSLIGMLHASYKVLIDSPVIVVDRQDIPDYVTIE
jgi:hypothetical protein